MIEDVKFTNFRPPSLLPFFCLLPFPCGEKKKRYFESQEGETQSLNQPNDAWIASHPGIWRNQHWDWLPYGRRWLFGYAEQIAALLSIDCIVLRGALAHDIGLHLKRSCISDHFTVVGTKVVPRGVRSDVPATQLPIPALKDWSRRRALIGHDLFRTAAVKPSSDIMESKGSKPREDIGCSVSGAWQSRIRARRRASTKATSVIIDGSSSRDREIINCHIAAIIPPQWPRFTSQTFKNLGGHSSLPFLGPSL